MSAVSLCLGPILAVAVWVFGNCTWSTLYCQCLYLREPLISLLSCSLGFFSSFPSLGPFCAVTTCALEFLSSSSLLVFSAGNSPAGCLDILSQVGKGSSVLPHYGGPREWGVLPDGCSFTFWASLYCSKLCFSQSWFQVHKQWSEWLHMFYLCTCLFWNFYNLILSVTILPMCMYVYPPLAWSTSKLEEDIRSPEVGVIVSTDHHVSAWKLTQVPLRVIITLNHRMICLLSSF